MSKSFLRQSLPYRFVIWVILSILILAGIVNTYTPVEAASTIGQIVYTDGTTEQIWIMNSDGSGKRQVTTRGGYAPAWSPDKSRIAFVRKGDLFTIRSDGSSEVRLTRDKFTDSDPTWSPDGQKVAFSSYRNGQGDLYVVNSTGGVPTQLTVTPGNEYAPDWSPDGSKLAFGMSLGGFDSGIATMPADGGTATVLYTQNNGVWDPSWSPDGTQLAWRKFDWAQYHLMIDATSILTSDHSISDPTWSPDATVLAYQTFEFGVQIIKTTEGTTLAVNARQPDWGTPGEFPVLRYAPALYLHPDENYWPISADEFINQSTLKWSHNNCIDEIIATPEGTLGEIDPWNLGDNGTAYKATMYKDGVINCGRDERKNTFAASDLTRPMFPLCPPDAEAGELCRDDRLASDVEGFFLDPGETWRTPNTGVFNSDVPVYYEFQTGQYIAYWFFYPRSIPGEGATPGFESPIRHDADWEHIVILLNADNTARAVRYYYHHDVREFAWDDLSLPKVEDPDNFLVDTDHPIVYVARNGHGSYWTPDCFYVPVTGSPSPIAADSCSENGNIWETWNNLNAVTEEPWYGFGGAWGEVGSSGDTTGPLGPSRYKDPLADG